MSFILVDLLVMKRCFFWDGKGLYKMGGGEGGGCCPSTRHASYKIDVKSFGHSIKNAQYENLSLRKITSACALAVSSRQGLLILR